MALEAGIAALKMLYQLAKMIKEARDNVIFVREKLESTLSIEKIIEISLARLDEEAPEAIMKEIQKRLAVTRRTARRMRMKYDPLVALLNSLGGGAAVIKAQAAAMRRGVLGASMALGTLSVMVRGHIERMDERARKVFEDSLQRVGVSISIDAILDGDEMDIQEQFDKAMARAKTIADEAGDKLNSEANRLQSEANAAVNRAQAKALAEIETAQAKANDLASDMKGRANKAKEDAISEIEKAQSKAESLAGDAVAKAKAKANDLSNDAKSKARNAREGALTEIGKAKSKIEKFADDAVNTASAQAKTVMDEVTNIDDKMAGLEQTRKSARGAIDALSSAQSDYQNDNDYSEAFYDDADFEADIPNELTDQSRNLMEYSDKGQKAMNAAILKGNRAASDGVNSLQSYSSTMIDGTAMQGEQMVSNLVSNANDSLSLAAKMSQNGKAQGLKMASAMEQEAEHMQAQANELTKKGKQMSEKLMNDAQNKVNDVVSNARNQVSNLITNQYDTMSDFISKAGNDAIGSGLSTAKDTLKSQLKIFKKAVNTCRKVYDMLDDLDGLVNELKSLEKKAVDEDEDNSNSAADSRAASVVPVRRDKHGNVIPPKQAGSFVKLGIKLLISQKLNRGKDCVEDADMKKLMGAGYTDARLKLIRRRVGDQDNDGYISIERFESWLGNECSGNVGICIAAIACALLSKLQVDSMPKIIQETADIVHTMMKPLIDHALGFGILLQCEEMRETYKEDPEEIAALQAEADEEALTNRMNLIKAFAVDFKEAFEHGFSPDPALMISIAIEAGTSFIGLGPTTRRRLELLYAIMSICNIEADKLAIEKVEFDLKSELQLLQSLGHGSSHDRIDNVHDHLNSAFDARRVLGIGTDTADFWVSSFGKDTFEVSWTRFRVAFTERYGRMNDKESKRLQMLLLDGKGNVTLDHIKAFTKATNGSLESAVLYLGKAKTMPRNLVEAGAAGGKMVSTVADEGVDGGDILNKRPLTASLSSGRQQFQQCRPRRNAWRDCVYTEL